MHVECCCLFGQQYEEMGWGEEILISPECSLVRVQVSVSGGDQCSLRGQMRAKGEQSSQLTLD